mgnify:CR=1 FL=1
MSQQPVKLSPATSAPTPLGARVGRVVAVGPDGVPQVDFPGNPHGPLAARLALSAADADRLSGTWAQSEVLLVFADHDMLQPLITGLVRQTFDEAQQHVTDWEGFRELCLRAREALTLECGDARITLRQDGKVVIVGRDILSRAQGPHRIRGATVDIN